MLADKTINVFIDELASDSPAPGGGSTAALVGALGAALCVMVMSLTEGRDEIAGEAAQITKAAELMKTKLIRYIDEDADAFNRVVAAYRLPKATAAEKEIRTAGVQAAMKEAADLPLAVATVCLELLGLAVRTMRAGNKNAASDAAVAGVITYAALHSALYNVKINLSAIKDEVYVGTMRGQVAALAAQSEELNREIRRLAEEIIG